MERRIFIKASGLVLAGGLSGLHSYAKPFSEDIKLTILHTNDMHSRIEPFPKGSGRNAGAGGAARRATLIKQIRKEVDNVLLLDAGDIFQGTPYFNFFGGELEMKLMSEMGYDAATMGNHDFDLGIEGFVKQLPHANFPFLVANYQFDDPVLKKEIAPYKIFKKAGLKIGVFGLGIELEGLVPDKLYKGTVYQDPIAIGKEMTAELKRKKCDLIICLSHLGNAYREDKISDQDLAKQVPGLDLIIGGHTHTFLDKPTELIGPENKKVLVNQVGWAGLRLGRIDYKFSPEKSLKNASGRALAV
ncbi:metallophosphatase [Flammeovirgaceae bacterium SG7u.111]|nr:metallophosphatase [Flammeovirgaceae bacterium SG7u.132]WPO33062.1 metallophosphatase [Flammeovirgaceae bacterium SG7u.111]